MYFTCLTCDRVKFRRCMCVSVCVYHTFVEALNVVVVRTQYTFDTFVFSIAFAFLTALNCFGSVNVLMWD